MTAAEPPQRAGEAGFALVEMLVAFAILSLVGLTLARFQTLQLNGAVRIGRAAAAAIEADNHIIDAIMLPQAPEVPLSGTSDNFGRQWHWTLTPGPPPDPMLTPDLVAIEVRVAATDGGPALATRQVLRRRNQLADEKRVARARAPQ